MPKQARRRSRQDGATPEAAYRAVDRFTFEVALLFFRMRVAATQYLGQGRHSTGRRSILKNLADGPQTVPAMAQRRAVSRQHIQKLVDTLKADGLVSSRVSPADRRSRLVQLTTKGRAFLDELRTRELRLFAELAADIPIHELEGATRVVQEVRGRLEGEDWERLLQNQPRSRG